MDGSNPSGDLCDEVLVAGVQSRPWNPSTIDWQCFGTSRTRSRTGGATCRTSASTTRRAACTAPTPASATSASSSRSSKSATSSTSAATRSSRPTSSSCAPRTSTASASSVRVDRATSTSTSLSLVSFLTTLTRVRFGFRAETSNLDGENNLKQRSVPPIMLAKQDQFQPRHFLSSVECEAPTTKIYQFQARWPALDFSLNHFFLLRHVAEVRTGLSFQVRSSLFTVFPLIFLLYWSCFLWLNFQNFKRARHKFSGS